MSEVVTADLWRVIGNRRLGALVRPTTLDAEPEWEWVAWAGDRHEQGRVATEPEAWLAVEHFLDAL